MNAAAAAIVSQIQPGTVLVSLRPATKGQTRTVDYITDKSVYFTNGKYENKRSMFHYGIA